MGFGVKHPPFPLVLFLLLAASSVQAQEPDDLAAQANDTRRQLIEQQQRATVCEVRSRRLEQQIIDLREQLAATRDALDRLVAQNAPPEPVPEEVPVATAETPENFIEVEELPEPVPEPPQVVDTNTVDSTTPEAGHIGGDGGQATPLVPPSVEALALYDEGYTLFHEKSYAEAASRFVRYVELYPSTELTDNAQFWIGECHYALKDFEAALAAFTSTVARFPDGNKVADALLKAGKSLMSLGEQEEAKRTFEEVVSRFPNSAAAASATELLPQ